MHCFLAAGTPSPDAIVVEEKKLEVVKQHRYLGSIISYDGLCSSDCHARIQRAQNRFNMLHHVWRDRGSHRTQD